MADVKWIKITTDIFDDEKVLLLESMPDADAMIVIWFKLLCLAGKQNNCGVFMINDRIPYTDEMFATIFRRPLNTVRMALNVFEEFGMIERIDGVVSIPKWEKHQNIEGLERIRQQTRDRVARHREKQKLIESSIDSNVTNNVTGNVTSDVTVTPCNDIEKNRIDKNRIDKNNNKRFIPPTIEEVQAYISEKGYHVDAEAWMAHYESNGWLVGKNKMKDWKAAVRTWSINGYGNNKKDESRSNKFVNYEQRGADYDALVRSMYR